MRINDIKAEFIALDQLIEQSENDFDEETGEFTDTYSDIQSLTKELENNRDGLVDYLADKKEEYKAVENGIAEKIKKLQDKKKTAQNQQQRLIDTIDYVLEGEKLKTGEHSFYYQKTVSVDILSEEDIPSEFIKFTPKIAVSELKKALKAGDEIKGAVLAERIGLRIR